MENKIALLIDSENISSRYIETIFNELTNNYGVVTVRKAYGDWTTDGLKPWKKCLLDYSITPVQQFSYTTHKNSTDSSMIIDAMDMLYKNDVDFFCLATSDCDFTRLAARLRESGKTVIGMGESKTPNSFKVACTEFKYIDLLEKAESEEKKASQKTSTRKTIKPEESITSIDDIKSFVTDYIGNSEGKVLLAKLMNSLKNKYSDFDVRNYGFSKFSTFLKSKSFDNFIVNTDYIYFKNKRSALFEEEFTGYILKSEKQEVTLVELQNLAAKIDSDFNLQSYGYNKMKTFIQSFNSLTVNETGKVTINK